MKIYQKILLVSVKKMSKGKHSLKYTIFSCKELEKLNCRGSKGIETQVLRIFNGYVTLLILYVVYDDVCWSVIYVFVLSLLDLKYQYQCIIFIT